VGPQRNSVHRGGDREWLHVVHPGGITHSTDRRKVPILSRFLLPLLPPAGSARASNSCRRRTCVLEVSRARARCFNSCLSRVGAKFSLAPGSAFTPRKKWTARKFSAGRRFARRAAFSVSCAMRVDHAVAHRITPARIAPLPAAIIRRYHGLAHRSCDLCPAIVLGCTKSVNQCDRRGSL
jgi:hypothetical protein